MSQCSHLCGPLKYRTNAEQNQCEFNFRGRREIRCCEKLFQELVVENWNGVSCIDR